MNFKQSILRLTICSLPLLTQVGLAESNADTFRMQEMTGEAHSSPVKIFPNVDIAFTNISGASSKVSFTAGADVDWFFTDNVGAFVGLDFVPIRAEDGGNDISVNYLDIPFGVGFNFLGGGSLAIGRGLQNSTGVMNVGLFVGVPMGDIDVGESEDINAKTVIGLNAEGHYDFYLSDNFGLGFHAGVKWGFTDIASDSDDNGYDGGSKPFTFSAGLSATFL